MTEEYTVSDLRVIMDGEDGTYVFEPDGLWLRVDEIGWATITQEEREAVACCNAPEVKQGSAHGGKVLVGLPEQRPLLAFPFTAHELLQFDEGTGGFVSEHLPLQEDEALALIAEWASAEGPGCETKHRAAELARVVLYLAAPLSKEADLSQARSGTRRSQSALGPQQKQEVIRRYKDKESVSSMAHRYGVDRRTIDRTLIAAKLKKGKFR